MKTIFLSLCLVVCGFISSPVLALGSAPPPGDLPRFSEVVAKEIYRGAQPTENGYKQLVALGVKTVIDLRGDGTVKDEMKWAEASGIKFINVPLSGFWGPSDTHMNEIESALTDPSLMPIFIHCEQGEDRTGLSIGLYRVFAQGWPPLVAWKEMEAFGFHKLLLGLADYFQDKTGFDP